MNGREFIIKVENGEGCNPEFGIDDKDLLEGIKADGFIIIAWDTEHHRATRGCMVGISLEDLMMEVRRQENTVLADMRESFKIAEGYLEAMEIHRRMKVRKLAERIAQSGDLSDLDLNFDEEE